MKKVYFDRQDRPRNIILGIIMLVFLIIYLISVLFSEFEKIRAISGIIGFGSSVIFFGKQLVFRYYLTWNKKGFIIKVNSFKTKSFAFSDISTIRFEKDLLEIVQHNGVTSDFDLSSIRPEDIVKMEHILKTNFSTTSS